MLTRNRLIAGMFMCALFMLLFSLNATSEDQKQMGLEDISEKLKALSPTFEAPQVDLFASPDKGPASLRLLGIDLAQNGVELSAESLQIDSKFPLVITAYWMPTLAPLDATMSVSVQFLSHDCRIARVEEIVVGPKSAKAKWLPGSVYRQTYEVSLQVVSEAFSGKSHMTISLNSQKGMNLPPTTLQHIEFNLMPRISARQVSARSLRSDSGKKYFGKKYRDLSVSFRLGYSAEHTISIPEKFRRGNAQIAIVSAFSYGSVEQSGSVCEVIMVGDDGLEYPLVLRSGVDTARADYDVTLPGTQNHEKARIIESWDADYLDSSNRPFKKHKYGCKLDIPEELTTLRSIKLRSTNPYLFLVYDVVLIPKKRGIR